MTTSDVVHQGEVSLNGLRYKLAVDERTKQFRPVQTSSGSRFAQKFVLGDFGTESRERVSVIRWDDFRGGILLERFNGEPGNLNRLLFGSGNIRHFHSMVLPPIRTTTSNVPAATGDKLAELNKEVYCSFGTAVHKYDDGGDTWGASLNTLTSTATDAITAVIAGTENLIFCTGTDYEFSTDGSTWNTSAKDTLKMAAWDDRLWGIDSTGQLWWTHTVGSGETDGAQLPLVPALTGEDAVGDLFVGPDAAGEPILYATCRAGLFAHDVANERWLQTDVIPPHGSSLGVGAIVWQKKIYAGIGLSIYEYDPVNGTVRSVGLDQEDGAIEALGSIIDLQASYSELIALTSNGTSTGYIFGWNGFSWALLQAADFENQSALVSTAYDSYRLWYSLDSGANTKVRYFQLQNNQVKPKNISGYEYESAGSFTFPWLEIGPDVEGLALRVKVETNDCTSTETVRVRYRANDDTSDTVLTTITTDGVTEIEFPDSTTPEGLAIRNIRFDVNLARGTTTTLSPELESLSLEFVRRLPVRYNYHFVLDVSQTYNGRTPIQMIKGLKSALESSVKVLFSFRDSGQDSAFPKYVEVLNISGLEETGASWNGEVEVWVSDS